VGRFQSRQSPQPAATVHSRPLLHNNGQIVLGVNNSLIAIDPATGHQHAILSAPVGDVVASPVYSPDGTKLAYLRGRVVNPSGNYGGSPDAMDSIWVLDTTTGHEQQLTTCSQCSPYDYISWSPDGSRLAFSEADQRGSLQLHLIKADGTGRTQLTHLPAGQNATQPNWSPDGTRIAFTSFTTANAPGQGIIFPTVNVDVTRPDGTGLAVLLAATPAELGQNGNPYLEPAWSPDGSRIAYLVDPWPRGAGVDFQLWLMDPDGSHRTQIFQYPNCCVNAWGGPAWSPDGTRIALVTAHTLWVMKADGTALTSPGVISGDRPAWQPLP
jgi:Tol biopolymer transport system component